MLELLIIRIFIKTIVLANYEDFHYKIQFYKSLTIVKADYDFYMVSNFRCLSIFS